MNDLAVSHLLKSVQLVGVASGCGGPDPGCESAPDTLRRAHLAARLRAHGFRVRWTPVIRPAMRDRADSLRAVRRVCTRLAQRVERILGAGDFPVVVGGDHSSAIGTWKGVARAVRAQGGVGLLWFDAHMDAHTPQTTESGMLHGMPLACLLGYGYPELTAIADGVTLDPRHVCLFGVRSFERGEAEFLERLGVRVFLMEEIERRGVDEALREAFDIVRRAQAGYGITLDLDAIDPLDAPGVGTPAAHGMRAAELMEALARHGEDARLRGIEVVEYNPQRDRQTATAGLVGDALEALLVGPAALPTSPSPIALEQLYGAHNYDPMPVVFVRGRGVHLWDDRGRRYTDMMSAYSAVSHGHAHPRLVAALNAQAERLAVTSRAYYNNRLPQFLKRLCEVTGQDLALPANTGLEAVEAALKTARKWALVAKGIADGEAEIIACHGNFHGRSIAILAMSTEAQYRRGFGPFPAGFKTIPYGDPTALEAAITPRTAAFLVEPIQGEAGIIVPPPGYLARCASICHANNVLFICDEIQTGLGRTGKLFGWEHDGVRPDGLILGKALGGGLMPVSAFAARHDLLGVLEPGDHGSTFAGSPLAAAVGLEALAVLLEERLPERAAELGPHLLEELRAMKHEFIRDVRGRGLLIGVEIDPRLASARAVCDRLLANGIVSKDTHETVVRFAPPLVISRSELDQALAAIRKAFAEVAADCHAGLCGI
jgi:ornithine--oxo-acid transaminase